MKKNFNFEIPTRGKTKRRFVGENREVGRAGNKLATDNCGKNSKIPLHSIIQSGA